MRLLNDSLEVTRTIKGAGYSEALPVLGSILPYNSICQHQQLGDMLCRLPRVLSSKGALGDKARCDVFTEPYWPTPFLYGPLQTLVASTLTAYQHARLWLFPYCCHLS